MLSLVTKSVAFMLYLYFKECARFSNLSNNTVSANVSYKRKCAP